MLSLIALLLISTFHDVDTCTIQGYVLRMAEVDVLEFNRADVCPSVRTQVDQNALMLFSPNVWVSVVIPPEHGHRRFMYRWGSNLAHLGPDTIPVQWGYVEKG